VNEIEEQKTSLGMRAFDPSAPGAPAPLPPGRTELGKPDNRLHVLGLGITAGVHMTVLLTVVIMHFVDASRANAKPREFVSIEAGLAIKKKESKGPKSRLPQKDEPKVKKPDDQKIASDPNAKPADKPKKEEDVMDPEEARRIMESKRGKPTDKPSDDPAVEGQDDGHKFGTLDKAKGDPYVGELIGRMTVDFTVPSVVVDKGLETWGCVKLDAAGKITDRSIDPEHKSKNHAFNSAVEDRLRLTKDMEQPVPEHLKKMLIGKFVCHPYRP
jgi:hypothetical protein